MFKWIVVMKIQHSICLDDWGKPRKNPCQVGRHRNLNPRPPSLGTLNTVSPATYKNYLGMLFPAEPFPDRSSLCHLVHLPFSFIAKSLYPHENTLYSRTLYHNWSALHIRLWKVIVWKGVPRLSKEALCKISERPYYPFYNRYFSIAINDIISLKVHTGSLPHYNCSI